MGDGLELHLGNCRAAQVCRSEERIIGKEDILEEEDSSLRNVSDKD